MKHSSDKTATLLTVDCGTQSLRVFIFSPTGELLAMDQQHYTSHFAARPGWAEQDPEIYWQSLIRGCRNLKRRHPKLFHSICGMGITTQRNSMVCVDAEGTPLRPVILWMDERLAPETTWPPVIKRILACTRTGGKLLHLKRQGACNWIRQVQPHIWQATHKFLQISGFLIHRLTGQFQDAAASQIGHIPFDYRRHRWAKFPQFSTLLFPIPADKLPALQTSGEITGGISSDAAEHTGLPKGLPLVACGSDKGCETLGNSVLAPDRASLSLGTTATVQTTTRRYVETVRFMPPYPAVLPGRYNPEREIFRGFWMVTWFIRQFGQSEAVEARRQGLPMETHLEQLLLDTPPGAHGLMVHPSWSPSLDSPWARGAMIGFCDIHTRAHIYRAIIEGLGFALKEGLEQIEFRLGEKIPMAAVCGGGARSDGVCQIMADILNRPVLRGETHETSGLGAAMITAAGLGIYPTIADASRKMSRIRSRFYPHSKEVDLYQEMYLNGYLQILKRLGPVFRSLAHRYNALSI